MNLALPSVSDDESEATQRLQLKARRPRMPILRCWHSSRRSIGNAAPEDINRLHPGCPSPRWRVSSSRACSRRKPGESYVDPFNPLNEAGEYAHNECVLVAINDDMPFLFDSC